MTGYSSGVSGFIKLQRALLSWEYYTDSNTKCLFIHLLLCAAIYKTECCGFPIPRGSLLTTIPRLAAETGLSVQKVRTSLKKLENSGEIMQHTTNKFRIIMLPNYDSWA